MEARSWQLRLGPTEKAGFLRQAVVVGQQLLAITFPQEKDPSVGAGLWAWDQGEGAFRLLLSGRFSSLAAADGGSFWVVSSMGSKLEKYSLAGQKLAEEALPFYALALGGEGEDLVSLRVPASGSGNLFWRRQGGKWKPWALPPTAAQDMETLAKANWWLFSLEPGKGLQGGVAAVKAFSPDDLLILNQNGDVEALFPLEVLRELPADARLVDLAKGPQEVYLLFAKEKGRVLCTFFLGQKTFAKEEVPPEASQVLLTPQGLALVGKQLQVWRAVP